MLKTESFANAMQITIEEQNNLFLVKEHDGYILVDTAVESEQIDAVIALIKETTMPLKAIVITHSHADHLGGLERFKAAFPETPVVFSEREYQLVLKKELLPTDRQVPLKEGIPDSLPVKPDVLVGEGDRIGEFEVLFTPGHTPGHICLYHPTERYLLVGDVMQMLGGAAICGVHRDAFPKAARLNWDLSQSVEVVKRFMTLHPRYIGTGHGDLMIDTELVLPKTIQEAQEILVASFAK